MKVVSARLILIIALLTVWVHQGFATETAKQDDKVGAVKKAPRTKISKRELIDINTSGQAELKAIPGLGDAAVAMIVAKRPYANKAQLVSRKVLPESVYERIKHLIIAKQPPRTPNQSPKTSVNKNK